MIRVTILALSLFAVAACQPGQSAYGTGTSTAASEPEGYGY